MVNTDDLLHELTLLSESKIEKLEWFSLKSGLATLEVDVNATLRKCSELIDEAPLQFRIADTEAFHELVRKSPYHGLQLYWQEILQRLRCAIDVSICRSQKWLEGVFLGVQYENLFVFASAYRGYIEAVADSLDALKLAIDRLAQRHDALTALLEDKPIRVASLIGESLMDQELEDSLIHFSHGRDTWREAGTAPKSHRKKKFGEYLASVNEEYREDVREAWFDLCQLTHPSAHSVGAYMFPTDANLSEWKAGVSKDFPEIVVFTLRHGDILAQLSNEFLMSTFYCYGQLCQLPYKKVHAPHLGVVSRGDKKH